ncbi:hypothetical protein PpBr36_02490 [Pyricularia pennisetigena]|nr:hypothetical protein PpBr36_02490 [Pyricularia pennisetigena]TLS31417.1 hypothetical protein PpBr36_02490 [Pyricularia pennisetigena]
MILAQRETIMGPDDRINTPDDINQDDYGTRVRVRRARTTPA